MVCEKCGKFYFKDQKHVHYGIWNSMRKQFQFNICETSEKAAKRALFNKIGTDGYKWRFKVKRLPDCEVKNNGLFRFN